MNKFVRYRPFADPGVGWLELHESGTFVKLMRTAKDVIR
jgi:hypothetical protein